MLYPKIQLKFNIDLDKQMAFEFYNNPRVGGCNFWKERVLKYHPKLSKTNSFKNSKIFLNNYIDDFYHSHSSEIKKLSKKTSIYINKSQKKFFRVVDKVFNDYKWPENKFVGYFSIFNFCPRFLDSNSFQIFIYDKRNIQLFTIFHEMLHFIFYDFAKNNFPKKFKNLNTDKGKFWDLAETFNVVIQNTDNFIKLHGKINNLGYPSHKNLIKRGTILWKKTPDIKKWITEMIKT